MKLDPRFIPLWIMTFSGHFPFHFEMKKIKFYVPYSFTIFFFNSPRKKIYKPYSSIKFVKLRCVLNGRPLVKIKIVKIYKPFTCTKHHLLKLLVHWTCYSLVCRCITLQYWFKAASQIFENTLYCLLVIFVRIREKLARLFQLHQQCLAMTCITLLERG